MRQILENSQEIFSRDKLSRAATISPLIETITPEESDGPDESTYHEKYIPCDDSLANELNLPGNQTL